MTFNFYESLNELVTDSRFRSLAVTQNFENFLNTYGINEAENMYTLSWLLTPNGSHGLKDMFFKEMITNAWTMVQGTKNFEKFATLSPMMFQHTSFNQTFVDREISKEYSCADMVITDVNSKMMVVINNKFNKVNCDKAFTYFSSDKFNFFENKMFISFDGQVQASSESNWLYMNNEWIINLCSNIIDCPQYSNQKVTGYMKDFYQFLTGSQYGVSHDYIADCSASLISDYYEVINQLKTFKAEKVANIALFDISPRDYASTYLGKISEKEYSLLSLCWTYRNTFNTFFQLADLQAVTKNMDQFVEKKPYSVESTFIRNGLRFTPCFGKVRTDKTFMNTLFSVEATQDFNKNLTLNLVVNKSSWDKLTTIQREAFQKEYKFSTVLKDQMTVWNHFYGQDFKGQDLCKEITTVFEKIDSQLSNFSFKVA